MVVWDRDNYTAEAEKQLRDKNVYKNIDFEGKILKEFTKLVIVCLGILRKRVVSQGRKFKYFSIECKKTTNLGKLYLLLKIHKC